MLLVLSLCFALIAISFAGPVEFKQVCGRGPFGGSGGSPFSDAGYAGDKITRVDIRSGSRIDGIQITYGTLTAPYHGGNGGDPGFFNLGSDEYIVEVEGRADSRVDQLSFRANLCNIYGTFGGDGVVTQRFHSVQPKSQSHCDKQAEVVLPVVDPGDMKSVILVRYAIKDLDVIFWPPPNQVQDPLLF